MDHEVAIKTHAVERYLLGEMPSDERDAFEDHYFTCAECADEVRSASMLIGDVKAALRGAKPAPKDSLRGLLSWLRPQFLVPAFAALSLAVVVGYQNSVVLPDLKAPRSMTSPLILDGVTRGELPAIHAGDALRFQTMVEGAPAGRVYVELATASGSRVRSGEVASPQSNRPLDVFFAGSLAPGRYWLIVRSSAGGSELTRSGFEILN
jgi:anti-sigma factor RsiW